MTERDILMGKGGRFIIPIETVIIANETERIPYSGDFSDVLELIQHYMLKIVFEESNSSQLVFELTGFGKVAGRAMGGPVGEE